MKKTSAVGLVKNFIILALVIVSLAQTGLIWFDGRSFFDVFSAFNFSKSFTPAQEVLDFLSAPTRMLAKTSENSFVSLYTDLGENRQKREIDELIKAFFKKGEYAQSYETDKRKLLAAGDVIYRYEYSIPSDVFSLCFGSKSNILSSKLDGVDFIIFKNLGAGVSITFASAKNALSYGFELDGAEYADVLRNATEELAAKSGALYYSVNGASAATLGDESFIPVWDGALEYYNVDSLNPYAENDSVTFATVQKKILAFFDNPGAVMPDMRNDAFAYSGGSVVVKYGANRIMEYLDFGAAKSKTTNSFLSSFSAALAILRKDESLLNDFYLAEYSYSDGAWKFCFDCSVADMPLFFSRNMFEDYGLSHIIEVTVVNDLATRYVRYVAEFSSDASFLSYADEEINSAASVLQGVNPEAEAVISELKLGYKIDEGRQLSLHWYMLVSGSKYIQPLF